MERKIQKDQLESRELMVGKQRASLLCVVRLSQIDARKSSHKEKEKIKGKSEGTAGENGEQEVSRK